MGTLETATDVRPFHFGIPPEQLDEICRLITATHWPEGKPVVSPSQGRQPATKKALARAGAPTANSDGSRRK